MCNIFRETKDGTIETINSILENVNELDFSDYSSLIIIRDIILNLRNFNCNLNSMLTGDLYNDMEILRLRYFLDEFEREVRV